LQNGTRVVFSSVGYYDKAIHNTVLNDIQCVIQRYETEVILLCPPDYMIVEVSHKVHSTAAYGTFQSYYRQTGLEILQAMKHTEYV
jgi:enhancing lycopene biosynthesis protein 2